MVSSDVSGLRGKTAIVTGGGAAGEGIGNGRAAAILLAREGARVLVVDRDLALAQRTEEMIRDEGGTAAAFAADVTDEAQCATVVKTALDRFGGLDILDNNVGLSRPGTVLEESTESWEHLFRVNLTSMMLMSKHAIRAMRSRGRGGAIVNVSSISALRPRGLTAYSASKGAIIAFTRAVAVDHGPDQIRVNCVAPGPVYTPHVASDGRMTDEGRRRRAEAGVLGIEGTGWDIGHAVVFLCSDRARYITGQTLVVDGGASIVGRRRE